MRLQMVGCSHHDVAVDIRERLSFSDAHVRNLYTLLHHRLPGVESVMVSTCNRVELYAVTPASPGNGSAVSIDPRVLSSAMAEVLSLDADFVHSYLQERVDRDAVEHLFLVAASLDSLVVGEAQILSQVKQAYDLANLADATGPTTHAVFQAANKAAKRVQTETSIHRRRLSVPSVAVGEVVPEVFETLRGKRVVLCGAGQMAEETLRYLKSSGANNICVINRNFDRGAAL
ncbi:MAG: glutamyl-tRNA reductase, partial [Planctomycetota bacterium]